MPDYFEAWINLPNSSWLDHSNPSLASDIKALPWTADGIDDTEGSALQPLLYLATMSAPAVYTILAFGWVLDGIDEAEAQAIGWLVIEDPPSASLLATIDEWSLESISPLDAEAIGYLSFISHFYDHDDALLSMDWIQDGVSPPEWGILRDIWTILDKGEADADAVIAMVERWFNPPPEPVVQMIYAIPPYREERQEYVTALGEAVLHVQGWYADRLEGRTFSLNAPVPEICSLPEPADYYAKEGGYARIINDLQPCAPVAYDSPFYVWAIYSDVPSDCVTSELGRGGGGITILGWLDLQGVVTGNADHCWFVRDRFSYLGGLAHELGHALGLVHPPGCDEGLPSCDGAAMMNWGYGDYPDTYFTEGDVEMLLESPFIHERLDAE